MISMDIRFDPGSMDRLRSSMRRVETELGKSSVQSLKWAARAVALSVGVSTTVSEKFRIFRQIQPNKQQRLRRKHARPSDWKELKHYEVVHWVKGDPELKLHSATGVDDLKRRILPIRRRGMCKRIWRSAISVAANRGRGRGMYFDVDSNLSTKSENNFVKMTNSLRYAAIAIKPNEVTSALDRAARGVIKRLENTLAKQGAA